MPWSALEQWQYRDRASQLLSEMERLSAEPLILVGAAPSLHGPRKVALSVGGGLSRDQARELLRALVAAMERDQGGDQGGGPRLLVP